MESLYFLKFTGVIEGFYGEPWTITQRVKLIDQFIEFDGLNTYVYAPKDDINFRNEQASTIKQRELDKGVTWGLVENMEQVKENVFSTKYSKIEWSARHFFYGVFIFCVGPLI